MTERLSLTRAIGGVKGDDQSGGGDGDGVVVAVLAGGSSLEDEMRHQLLTADGRILYVCPMDGCGERVPWSHRSHHRAVHSGRACCTRCGRSFVSVASLWRHRMNCKMGPVV